MNVNVIFNGSVSNITKDEQKDVVEQLKGIKVFDLDENQRTNLINFICENLETELAVDYLFHVLDNEISYPIDDDKVKLLFADDRMKKLNQVMMEQLEIEEDEVSE